MSLYTYRPLSSVDHATRLLRLLPDHDEAGDICCELFEFALEGFPLYRYDALSYTWGDPNETVSISIDGYRFFVTSNLYAALSRLRHHSFARALWIDAICINQEDHTEKEQQIQFMTSIYSQANCVIVWLGEAADNSDLACELIRDAAAGVHRSTKDIAQAKRAEFELLRRTWFRRVWILQEVAAARDIMIMCGRQILDADTFCSGIDTSNEFQGSMDLASIVRPVCYLMKQSLPVSCYSTPISPKSNLRIGSLAELVEMYFTHEATKRHDKVYALLGMCLDDLSKAGLSPDYQLPWDLLLQRLIKHLLSEQVCVETHVDRIIAVIRSKGRLLGEVIRTKLRSADDYEVFASFKKPRMVPGEMTNNFETILTIKNSPFWTTTGDLICLIQGTSSCTIIRPCQDYFRVVVLSLKLPDAVVDQLLGRTTRYTRQTEALSGLLCERELLLVWNRETTVDSALLSPGMGLRKSSGMDAIDLTMSESTYDFETWTWTNRWNQAHPVPVGERYLASSIRMWNAALLFGDLWRGAWARDAVEEAVVRFQDAMTNCEVGMTDEGMSEDAREIMLNEFINLAAHAHGAHSKETLLSRAAHGGHNALIKYLLEKHNVDVNVASAIWLNGERDSRDTEPLEPETPLMSASRRGHTSAVRELLKAHEIDVSKGNPLVRAVKGRHEAVVKLLLQTGCVDVNAWSTDDSKTPLWWAAIRGNEAIVRLLLDTRGINVDANIYSDYSTTPLFEAARHGHDAVVRMLLETNQVQVDFRDHWGNTPLSIAAKEGHEAVFKLLLETGNVNLDQRNTFNETPVSYAVSRGNEVMVRLLLATGKIDVNRIDAVEKTTPLLKATSRGHASVVRSLLESGNVKVDVVDYKRDTPLHIAAASGNEEITRLLLGTGRTRLSARNLHGDTALDVASDEVIRGLLLQAASEATETIYWVPVDPD